MTFKTSSENTGYDLSSTDTILKINTETLLYLGWQINGGSAADYVVEIQPENSSTWYQIDSYSSVTSVDDGVTAPEADFVRVRNTTTVADTADVVIGGARDDN